MSVTTGVFRLGQDAEVRYLPNGDPVATLSLACNYGKKDPNTGFRKSQWYDAGLWGDRAASLAPHLTKGTTVFAVLEDVHIEVYRNRDGAEKAKLAARVASIEFVGGRGDRDSQGDAQAPRQASTGPAPAAPASRPARPAAAAGSGFEDMDDDIPFADPLKRRGAHLVL